MSEEDILTNPKIALSPDEFVTFYRDAANAMDKTVRILQSDDWLHKSCWKLEAGCDEDAIYSRKNSGEVKMYIYMGIYACSAEKLFYELNFNFENAPEWNPEVAEFRRIFESDDCCFYVAYMSSHDLLGGLVQGRDYLTARCWKQEPKGSYIIAETSIDSNLVPQRSNRVRANSPLHSMYITPNPDNENECFLQWLVQTDLRGSIPKSLIERVSYYFILNHARQLRTHAASL